MCRLSEKVSSYNIKKIDAAIKELKQYAGNLGFAFLEVKPKLNRNETNKKIDIIFIIGEAKKVYVRRIDIKGNSRTEDRVIRREFRFSEGDFFNNEKLARSRQRVQNLGFFEN